MTMFVQMMHRLHQGWHGSTENMLKDLGIYTHWKKLRKRPKKVCGLIPARRHHGNGVNRIDADLYFNLKINQPNTPIMILMLISEDSREEFLATLNAIGGKIGLSN